MCEEEVNHISVAIGLATGQNKDRHHGYIVRLDPLGSVLGGFDLHQCMLKHLVSSQATIFKTIRAGWVFSASSRRWRNTGRIILECVHKRDIFDLRWHPMRSSGSILSRCIMRRPIRSSAILGWRPLRRRIVWHPLRSSSILISYLIPVIQFGFPVPRNINRSHPFIH